MHELSMCESIYKIVDRTSAGRPVTVIHLEVGQLRQVVPDTLTYCWTIVSDQTALSGSQLVVHTVPVTLLCLDCSSTTTLTDELLLLCTRCDGAHVRVTNGEELMLTSLELAEA